MTLVNCVHSHKNLTQIKNIIFIANNNKKGSIRQRYFYETNIATFNSILVTILGCFNNRFCI